MRFPRRIEHRFMSKQKKANRFYTLSLAFELYRLIRLASPLEVGNLMRKKKKREKKSSIDRMNYEVPCGCQ